MDEKSKDNLGEVSTDETLVGDNSQEDDQESKEARYKQQLAGSTAEALRLRTMLIDSEVKKASQDAQSLKNLHNVDPKLAKEVSEKMDWEKSQRKDYETFLKGDQELSKKSEVDIKAQFESMYQERKAQELHDLAIQKASKLISKIKDESMQKQAQTYFDKITKGKVLSIDEAEEFAEMATLYVNKDNLKSEKYNDGLAQFASTGVSTSKKATSEESYMVVRNGKKVYLDAKGNVLLDSNDNK